MLIYGGATPPPARTLGPSAPADPLKGAACELERAFVSELLKCAGLDDALSGGAGLGGSTFASFAVDSYAEQFVAAGGLGLADAIYRQLKESAA
jgi:Rod binding domain-containing protein